MTDITDVTPSKGRLYTVVEDDDNGYDELSDEEKAFNSFRNDIGAEDAMAEVSVSRIPRELANSRIHAAHSKSYFCFSCPVDMYTFSQLLEAIRSEYGGGTYRIIGTKKGKRGTAFNRLINIAEPRNKSEKDDGHSMGGILDAVHKMLAEQQTRNENLLASVFERLSPQNSGSPLGHMREMAEIFAIMRGMEPKTDLKSELEKVQMLNDLMGNENKNEDNFYSMMGAALKTLGGPLMAAAAGGMPQLPAPATGPATGHTAPTAPIPPQRPPAAPNPSTAPQPTPQPTPQPEKEPAPMVSPYEYLRPQINALVDSAAINADPEDIAKSVIEHTPAVFHGQLRGFITRPDCLDIMGQLNERVPQYREWFVTLQNSLILFFDPDAHSIESENPAAVESDGITDATRSDDGAVTGDT